MEITSIIFDMGGVLIDFDPKRSVNSRFDKKYHDSIMKNTFLSPDWSEMDKGTVEVDDVIETMCSRLPEELHSELRAMITEHEKEMPPIKEMYPLIKSLKENGYKIYLLSNCPAWFDDFKKSVPAFDFFDGFIISALYNQIKPEEEIYHTLFNEFSLIPGECFFIDDTPANVETAKRLGMNAHCFADKDVDKLKSALKNQGVKI